MPDLEIPVFTEPEVVHEDFGDEPVEARPELSVAELEKRAVLGELKAITRTMEKGDSLLGLLAEQNVPANERMEIVEALELLIDLKALRPGMTFLFFQNPEGKLEGLSLQQQADTSLAVLKDADGSWVSFSETGRVETKQEYTQILIERTLAGSAEKAGVPANVVNQIVGAFDGEFDFATEIQPDDVVEVMTEYKITEGGLEIGARDVIYIGLKTPTKSLHKYAYNNTFYDARGRTSEKTLMKRPLKARPRLSSAFGNRQHPILQYKIFHKGVDLAAPMNTPVQAGADGTIQMIGRKGSYGKYIKMKHKGGYETAYAHLNGYRQDLKVGSKVKRGEVIAYVGSTGRSTGPHLHYEVIKNGKVVNPLGTNKIASTQLEGFELEKFQSWADSIHPDFKIHLAGKIPPVPTQKPFDANGKPRKVAPVIIEKEPEDAGDEVQVETEPAAKPVALEPASVAVEAEITTAPASLAPIAEVAPTEEESLSVLEAAIEANEVESLVEMTKPTAQEALPAPVVEPVPDVETPATNPAPVAPLVAPAPKKPAAVTNAPKVPVPPKIPTALKRKR